MHMFGGEVEHDGPSKAEVTASSTSTYSTSAAASQGKAEDEPHESAKPGSSRARNEVSRLFVTPVLSAYFEIPCANISRLSAAHPYRTDKAI